MSKRIYIVMVEESGDHARSPGDRKRAASAAEGCACGGDLRDWLAALLGIAGPELKPKPKAARRATRGWQSAVGIGDRPEIRLPASDPRATPQRPSDGPLTDTD